MKHISTYLKHLKFDNGLTKSLIAKYILNLRLIILIVLGIVVFGTVSFLGLPRNLFPDVTIPDVIVTTVLPGAGPTDVESLVSIPVEDAVTGITGVKTVTSSSSESVSSVVVEFNTGVDIDKAKSDVQSAVDSITTIPSSAQKSQVMKIDLQKTPIWTFALSGGKDQASLIRFSQKLKQDLTDLLSVDSVNISGAQTQEIQIVVRPEAVSTYKINPQQLIAAVKSALSSYPSGSVRTDNSTFALTIDQQITTIDDIRQTKLNLGGQTVSISDIADVLEISKPGELPVYVGEKNGKISPAVTFDVFRVTNVNIEKAQKDAQDLIEKELSNHPEFRLLNEINYAKQITDQFSELQKDLIETIILVATVLFLFLGARQAFVALLATPLTFLISFTVMNLTGITLNFLSVFALLLSLGLLVDDTIVVVSAISAYDRAGKFSPIQTGLLVFRDFIAAITTTTSTTIWAFLPILIAGGIIGLFIKPIPIVVSTTLAGSFFVAIFITLPFMIFLLNPQIPKRVVRLLKVIALLLIVIFVFNILPKNSLLVFQFLSFMALLFIIFRIRKNIINEISKRVSFRISKKQKRKFREYFQHGVISLQRVEFSYSEFIYRILNSKNARKRILIMVIIFSIFSYLLVPLGFVKNEFFPKSNADTMSVSVELPSGTNLKTSSLEALNLLVPLAKTPETDYVILNLGAGGGFAGFGGGAGPSENVFNYTLVFKEHKKLTSSEIADYLRSEFKNYNKGILSVNEATGGPPAGSDIQIKLFGPDLTVLDNYANKTAAFLKNQQGTTNVSKSVKQGTSKIVFVPDEQKLAASGLTTDTTGFWLRLFATGLKIDSIKLDQALNTSEDITLRMQSSTPNADDITSVNIPTANGVVPISSLGKLTLEPNPTLITREGGKRTISVTAGVKSGYTVPSVNSKLESFANTTLNLPPGYSWQTGGVNEQNQQSVGDIYKAMLISILLIIITMVLQFQSFRRAIIVILVIPLAISGVFVIFSITQIALTFPALIGVLALFGIVVKNSILIVDRIVANIKTGMEFNRAIADAASSRLEPIALTSICAIVGLIPITLSDPLWRGLGGAIIAGLTFSGTIMLIFIPVVYYYTFKPSNKK
ncbi:MAG TPA: efflux RND transporter permease subunit [Candidatus Sulfotelmatobacter sp.]|nr:efflux RND transporter permease subunit [Candidatus Sulfotelmatobacter sp.]